MFFSLIASILFELFQILLQKFKMYISCVSKKMVVICVYESRCLFIGELS